MRHFVRITKGQAARKHAALEEPVNPDLYMVTRVFLVPSSFLVAALGTADTNPHRAMVSVLGFIVSVLWLVCSREAFSDPGPSSPSAVRSTRSRRAGILANWLPLVFIIGWFISIIMHVWLWSQPIRA
jgi:hypothetical protein